jgi:hypothetical protein
MQSCQQNPVEQMKSGVRSKHAISGWRRRFSCFSPRIVFDQSSRPGLGAGAEASLLVRGAFISARTAGRFT